MNASTKQRERERERPAERITAEARVGQKRLAKRKNRTVEKLKEDRFRMDKKGQNGSERVKKRAQKGPKTVQKSSRPS